jgi:L-malate glycosyltransferase
MASLLKIAFISHSYLESSCRRKLLYLAQATDFQLITPSWYPTPYGRYEVDFEFNHNVPVKSYPIVFPHFMRTSTRWLLNSRDLGLSQFLPDIIHIENEQHSWIACQTLLYRRMFAPKAKVVLFLWNNLEEFGIKTRLLEQVARINRRVIDFFICGNFAGKKILEAKGIPEEDVEVLPQYGIDPEIFHPYSNERIELIRAKLGIQRQEFTIGFVGRFVEEKGLLDLVEAAGRLSQLSNRKISLVLTGKGDLEPKVRAECARLDIKLILLSARKYHEMAEVMNVLDVLVLPSQSRRFWKEQFGRVLIEAMACGVPVIGSDSGEIPNVIGEAGLIFHECNRQELAECLRLCCENESVRLTLRDRGIARVLSKYTNQQIAHRTLEIYDRLLVTDEANGRVPQNI